MIKEPFEYLKNFDLPELKALLVQIPAVRDVIFHKQLFDIIGRIPKETLEEYYATASAGSVKKIREWISMNCTGNELTYMYQHFNLGLMGAI